MNFIPTGDRPKGDVGIARDQRHPGCGPPTGQRPVVAANAAIGVDDDFTDPFGAEFIRGYEVPVVEYRLLVAFTAQEFRQQRPVTETTACDFWDTDHGEPAGEIPAKFIFDRYAVDLAPPFRAIIEQIELDRHAVFVLIDPVIDACSKRV